MSVVSHRGSVSLQPGSVVGQGGAPRRLPRQREARTTAFRVGPADGFLIASRFSDGSLAEISLIMAKQGSTLRGMTEAFAIAVSTGLQQGVSLVSFVRKFADVRFEPAGRTDDPEIPYATSVMDYVIRRLALDFLPRAERAALGVFRPGECPEGQLVDPVAVSDAMVFSPIESPFRGDGLIHAGIG